MGGQNFSFVDRISSLETRGIKHIIMLIKLVVNLFANSYAKLTF